MDAIEGVQELYRERFDSLEREKKNRLWKILCGHLQRYFPREGAVLDLGAGYCEFINNIQAVRKVAVDMNPDTAGCAAPGVTVYKSACSPLPFLESGSMDAVFLSNVLEHLANKDKILEVMREVHRILKPGGRMVVLTPNIRFAYREYWDFFDHLIPLTEKSVVEAALMAGFQTHTVIAAFLPYTTKSRLPQWDFLVRTYLAIPPLWALFGKQALIVVEKLPPRK